MPESDARSVGAVFTFNTGVQNETHVRQWQTTNTACGYWAKVFILTVTQPSNWWSSRYVMKKRRYAEKKTPSSVRRFTTSRLLGGRCRKATLGVCIHPKLQAPVYDILPLTTALFSYATGSRKLSANEQFFFCFFLCSNSSKFVTNNSDKTRCVIYSHQQSLDQDK